jgi:hypothetical protein
MAEPRKQFRVVNKGKGVMKLERVDLHKIVGDNTDEGLALNTITDYRSEIENDGFIYSGYKLNSLTPVIKRVFENTTEFAQNVVDLEVSWADRLNLTYV